MSLAGSPAFELSPVCASKYAGGLPGNYSHAIFCLWDAVPSNYGYDEGIYGGWLDKL